MRFRPVLVSLAVASLAAGSGPPASSAAQSVTESAAGSAGESAASCVDAFAGASPDAASGASPSAPAGDVVRRVVAISVDGLSPTAIRRLGRAGTPAMHRMIARGASTLDARTARESTSTLPNHTGMLTGRRASAAAGGHGVVFNTDTGVTVHDTAGEYVAGVFDVVHDHDGSTALYAGKSKFDLLDRSWAREHGAADAVPPGHGRDKIDRYVRSERTDRLVTLLVRQLRRDPATFTFVHLRPPDAAGHRYGYLGRRYLRAVRRTDALVGRVLSTIARKPSLRRHTTVLLTADHGGHGGRGSRSHDDPRRPGNYRVPFLVWGASVARGAGLYALNPDRRRPGPRRTTYRGRQPVRNADLANLATDLLGLPAVPGSQLNRPADLDVRRR